MTEQELIQKIQSLKHIQPSNNWAVSVKKEILGPEHKTNYVEVFSGAMGRLFSRPFIKPVFVTISAFFVIIGTFSLSLNLSQNSLPGDLLYSMKQLSEGTQTFFVSADEKSNLQLEFAAQKVDELAKVAARPETRNDNLIVAIKALNNNISAASRQIKNVAPEKKEALAAKTEELIKKTQSVLTDIQNSGNEEVSNALFQIVANEIKDLENRTLTEEQSILLAEVKKEFEAGNFGQALEKIWQISNR